MCVCVCVREREREAICYFERRKKHHSFTLHSRIVSSQCWPKPLTLILYDKQIITGTLMLVTASVYGFAAISGGELDIDPGLPMESVPGTDSTAFGTFA